jgi:hypothetical protein
MTGKLLVLVGAALALLMVSATADPADAGGRSGQSFRGGGGSFGGARSYGGGPSSRPQFRPPAQFGNRPQGFTSRPPGSNYGQYGNGRRHHRHRRIFVGGPIFYGGYYYYYGHCDWLRRRAIATGSPYWWNRYNTCVYDGY